MKESEYFEIVNPFNTLSCHQTWEESQQFDNEVTFHIVQSDLSQALNYHCVHFNSCKELHNCVEKEKKVNDKLCPSELLEWLDVKSNAKRRYWMLCSLHIRNEYEADYVDNIHEDLSLNFEQTIRHYNQFAF